MLSEYQYCEKRNGCKIYLSIKLKTINVKTLEITDSILPQKCHVSRLSIPYSRPYTIKAILYNSL